MQPGLRRSAPNAEEVAGADRTAASIPSSSAWPMPGETAAPAGATRLRTPTGPAARHTDAIAAAIRVGRVEPPPSLFGGRLSISIPHHFFAQCEQTRHVAILFRRSRAAIISLRPWSLEIKVCHFRPRARGLGGGLPVNVAESWSRKSEQGDKWSFCLQGGTLGPASL